MNRKLILLTAALLAATATTVRAQDADDVKQEYTVVKQLPITSIKNQNRSGTCWCYATLGFLEAEILRATGRTYDLSEMFVANKDYMDCAEYHVRMHGYSRFSEGGSADDVIEVIRHHGVCPEDAMPAPGSLVGAELADFTEFFSLLEPYVEAVAGSKAKTLTPQWREGMQAVLDAYLGSCPPTFSYEGRTYTPQEFAASLGLNWDDYISLTSFSHHPFYEPFVIEAPYKWRPRLSYNLPLDELLRVMDSAIDAGYTMAWGGDVSGNGFTRTGKADNEPGVSVSQEERQRRFDSWQATYDHVMVIYGTARGPVGQPCYMVKNSWGDAGEYHGTWYMSRDYMALNTTYVFLNKHAIPADILRKLSLP